MYKFIVEGPTQLKGEIVIDGSKNSALPILTASLLAEKEVVIKNVPKINDVFLTLEILNELGCKTIFSDNSVIIVPKDNMSYEIPQQLSSKLRSSVLFIGALLGKNGNAIFYDQPGGCEIGKRPIDLHLEAFKQLCVEINQDNHMLFCKTDRIIGNEIFLQIPSVGATENIMLASVKCRGTTIIKNAAKEPEIVDLARFLIKLGAKIKGVGTDTIIIEGVEKLNGSIEHKVIPDRIIAGTYLCAVASTGGEIVINNVIPSHLDSLLNILKNAGCSIIIKNDYLHIKKIKRLNAISKITTSFFPGFPTDLQPLICSVFSLANGVTVIKETIFENRFKHISELAKMGAKIINQGDLIIINGVERLYGTNVNAKDLRGGASLLIAAMSAYGQSIINNIDYIDRGYEEIENRYNKLGAKITRVSDN
ncbi:UDP-N-acetylglucosamine 1-carboxyvinyltransferase [Caldicellulosiruptoraceae bacterium PP1]